MPPNRLMLPLLLLLPVLLLPGPASAEHGGSPAPQTGVPPQGRTDPLPGTEPVNSIGTATMLADGTILLQLRAEVPGGVLGDALLRYAPGNPDYRAVRDHLPALRPGGTVVVPPFP